MSSKMASPEERIAIVETKVAEMSKTLDSIETKLDEVLELKNKGMGAFWLASALIGSGILSGILACFQWIKGG